MTDRERLIELCDTNNGWVDEVPAEKFADYLLANGVIVPPCKVGDTVTTDKFGDIVLVQDIDNLLKELVGEDK